MKKKKLTKGEFSTRFFHYKLGKDNFYLKKKKNKEERKIK